jgi:hypothetical protein
MYICYIGRRGRKTENDKERRKGRMEGWKDQNEGWKEKMKVGRKEKAGKGEKACGVNVTEKGWE